MRLLYLCEESDELEINQVINRSILSFMETDIIHQVEEIIGEVARRGDSALIEYTERFDQIYLMPESIRVTKEEIEKAYNSINKNDLASINLAIKNVKDFHNKQVFNSWFKTEEDGVVLGQIYRPIEKLGLYIPGGRASLASTVLMSALPAKAAGVDRILICTPPNWEGRINPYILATAHLVGIDEIYKVGGAQAIGAIAFGTETIPKVDKIVGPGNIYVTLAKRAVYGYVSVDMIAGPTEVVIIADDSANSGFITADLLSQIEHDPMAVSILITTSEHLALQVSKELEIQSKSLSRQKIIQQSIGNGALIITETLEQAIDLANKCAPEHLELQIENPWQMIGKIKHAGAIFIGKWSSESVGDYLAGPSHVLPTSGTSRFFSPLGVEDFLKRSSIISYSEQAIKKFGNDIIRLAELEGLDGHANAIKIRLEQM